MLVRLIDEESMMLDVEEENQGIRAYFQWNLKRCSTPGPWSLTVYPVVQYLLPCMNRVQIQKVDCGHEVLARKPTTLVIP
jgi:hypothetical protein